MNLVYNYKLQYIFKNILAIAALACLAFLLFIKSSLIYEIIAFLIFLTFVIIIFKFDYLLSRILGQGNINVIKLLNYLPKSYFVFNAINIETNNKIDHLIIGPTGIFCLMVLDWQGEIKSSGMDWIAEGKAHKSPVILLSEQTKIINEKIKFIGKNIPIQPIIVFTSPSVNIKAMPYNIPIVKYKNLARYLNEHLSGKIIVAMEDIKNIVQIIKAVG